LHSRITKFAVFDTSAFVQILISKIWQMQIYKQHNYNSSSKQSINCTCSITSNYSCTRAVKFVKLFTKIAYYNIKNATMTFVTMFTEICICKLCSSTSHPSHASSCGTLVKPETLWKPWTMHDESKPGSRY